MVMQGSPGEGGDEVKLRLGFHEKKKKTGAW